jgi:hypothetical protein
MVVATTNQKNWLVFPGWAIRSWTDEWFGRGAVVARSNSGGIGGCTKKKVFWMRKISLSIFL